ncbi:hypothetical protein I4U23_010447 [Adineta vaga]|nr:hypothetical protein I4U23_010447 [Adineta vaga]
MAKRHYEPFVSRLGLRQNPRGSGRACKSHIILTYSSHTMYCQRVFFWVFLVIYILTGIILAVVAHFINNTNEGYKQYGSRISDIGRYYIGGIAVYILITGTLHIMIGFLCTKRLLFFRIAFIFLVVGIMVEITAVSLIILMRAGFPVDIRKTTIIVISSLTGYLVILQMYGIIASLSYYSELRHSYEIVASK